MNNFMGDDKQGPGTYDDGNSFGKGVPTFTFPPSPKKKSPETSPGPGSYTPERADSLTKGRNQECSFSQ